MKFSTKSNTNLLIKQASDHLGIDLSGMEDDREAVMAAIKAKAPTAFDMPADKPKTPVKSDNDRVPSHVLILIPETGEDMEEDFVAIGANSRMYQLRKGEEIEVPYVVYSVLNDAVETVYLKKKDELGRPQLIPKDRKRYPFQTIEFLYKHGNVHEAQGLERMAQLG